MASKDNPEPRKPPPPPPGFARRADTDRTLDVSAVEEDAPPLPEPPRKKAQLPKPKRAGGAKPESVPSAPTVGSKNGNGQTEAKAKSAKSNGSSPKPPAKVATTSMGPPKPPPPRKPRAPKSDGVPSTAKAEPSSMLKTPSNREGSTESGLFVAVPPQPDPPPPKEAPNAEPLIPTIAMEAVEEDRPKTVLDTYREDARIAIKAYEAELVREKDNKRIGRLNYEAARLHETVLKDNDAAAEHYKKALTAIPDHLPTVVGARRTLLARGDYAGALPLYDREIRVTADRSRKGALLYAKGRLLEDHLRRAKDARDVYETAAEACDGDPSMLKALEQTDFTHTAWDRLGRVLARSANAVASDPRHRSSLVSRRARLAEVHASDPDAAAELYENSLNIDPEAPGALESLKRLHYTRKRWRELIRVLEREAERSKDPAVRSMAMYRIGQIHAERLGNDDEAIGALERAAREPPVQPLILDALARLYERSGNNQALAATLARLAETTEDTHERLGLLHRIGQLCRDRLDDVEAAVRAYEAALALDPTYIPALRALSPLFSRQERWDDLVRMHIAEADNATEVDRRAVAHARAAEILERQDKYDDAIEHHEHALALNADFPASFKALVRLYNRSGEHRRLAELYRRKIDAVDDERGIEYLFRLGELHGGPLKEPELAEHAYREVLRQRPKHLGAIHALQRVAEAWDRHRELVTALELEVEVIRDKKELVALLYRAGEILEERIGDRVEALERFRRVLSIEPNDVATLAALGRIYHAEGHWADLVDVFGRELKSTPRGPAQVVLLQKMGEVYEKELSDRDRAVGCYRQALEIDPRHGPALHALSRILRERRDWAELVALNELERDNFRDPGTRALAAYRAGELYEEHLDDRTQAERLFSQSLELRPNYRPASDALARVRTQLEKWRALAEGLDGEASTLADQALAVSALMRAAEIWWDHLGEADRAIACCEQVLDLKGDHIGAMLELETLYRHVKAWDRLAPLYGRQSRVLTDPGARVAALRERARLLEAEGLGNEDDLVDCYTNILSVRPDDHQALAGLERLALGSNDPRVLASVDARLAANTSDSSLKAAYLTRQAESLELGGGPQALEIYRQALTCDPHNRAALRGLSRVAEVLGDGAAMAEAARREAEIAPTPEAKATAWVRSGVVHSREIGDRETAARDFERALELFPDHEQAADEVTKLLTGMGKVAHLVDVLSNAAAAAKLPERTSALWIKVAALHVDALGNLGAALAALRRLLREQPKNPKALLEISEIYVSDRRWDEAVDALEKLMGLKPGIEVMRRAHVHLALAHQHLGDAPAAFKEYDKALDLAPADREVLRNVGELQMAEGIFAAAVNTATRLLTLAESEDDRVGGLVFLARAEAAQDHASAAVDSLAEAVALQGPGGTAAGEMGKLATEREHWERYVEALEGYLSERDPDVSQRAALYLEIARVQQDHLGGDEQSLLTLVQGLRVCEGDPSVRFELANRLRKSQRLPEAVEEFQQILMDDVFRIEAWRYLAQTFREMARGRESAIALAPLVVLEEATPEEREVLRRWEPRTDYVRPGAFAPQMTVGLQVAPAQQQPATVLMSSMLEGLAKVRPPNLAAYGLSSRDKIAPRSEHPLRALVERLAGVFGVEEYDLYIHRVAQRGVAIENTPRPSLLLPLWVAELAKRQQVYVIAEAMAKVAAGVCAVDLFTDRELTVLFAAAGRQARPTYGEAVANAAVLDDQLRLIVRGLPRRKRRPFEAAAENYVAASGPDMPTWVQWTRQTARRIALVLADDLTGSIEMINKTREGGQAHGIASVRKSTTLTDLVKVWISQPAMAVRRTSGLLEAR